MVVNVLVAYSHMNTRDFKQYEIGKKYLQRIKDVAYNIVIEYFKEIYDPNNFEIKWSYNSYEEYYKTNYDKLADVAKNVSMMNKNKFDLVIVLIDKANEVSPDPVLAIEVDLCNILRIPIATILFDDIVAYVKSTENVAPLIAHPRREGEE